MNTVAISLGLRSLELPESKPRQYVDGKPKRQERWHRDADGLTAGQRARNRIMALVEEWGEIDRAFLLADEEIELSYKSLDMILAHMVTEGLIVRYDPAERGQPTTWTRGTP